MLLVGQKHLLTLSLDHIWPGKRPFLVELYLDTQGPGERERKEMRYSAWDKNE